MKTLQEKKIEQQQKEVFDYVMGISKKLLEYKEKGYLIVQDDDYVVDKIFLTGFSDDVSGLKIGNIVYYHGSPDLDNGYYDSLESFKKFFSTFKICNPKDFKSLI